MSRTRDRDDLRAELKEPARKKTALDEDQAAEIHELGARKTHTVIHGLEGAIRQNPLPSVLAAAGAGLLFGRFRVRPLESLLAAAGGGFILGALMISKQRRR